MIKSFLMLLIFFVTTGLMHAKVYPVIESVHVSGKCKIIVVAWYDDNGTPTNSADDRRLATDTLEDCP